MEQGIGAVRVGRVSGVYVEGVLPLVTGEEAAPERLEGDRPAREEEEGDAGGSSRHGLLCVAVRRAENLLVGEVAGNPVVVSHVALVHAVLPARPGVGVRIREVGIRR